MYPRREEVGFAVSMVEPVVLVWAVEDEPEVAEVILDPLAQLPIYSSLISHTDRTPSREVIQHMVKVHGEQVTNIE